MDLDKVLDGIQKPGRYIGGEYNSIRKNWDTSDVKVCLSYPDIYEIGMSYLGMQILYHIINKTEHTLCERVFAPWPDMEEKLRQLGIDLFSIESRRPLHEFDIVGFSLGYELIYTNMLNIIDLGGIKVFSKDRGPEDPLIIAGGPCAFNPAPVSEFIDVFFIGDGEESILEFVDVFRGLKKNKAARNDILARCAGIEGVYVPSIQRKNFAVRKRILPDLSNDSFPTSPLVPFIKTIHDRVALEVMRGCPHTCRFCQARSIYSPVRIRTKEKVISLAAEALNNTGYEEVSFLSLSSANYPYLLDVIDGVHDRFLGCGVHISIPSLRIEDLCQNLPERIARGRKTGFTFALEAGSERLRTVISKPVDIQKLYQAIRVAFRAGWRRIKLYFMIGLPGETEDDLRAIAEVIYHIKSIKKEVSHRGRVDIILSVNSFIPKAHTPFQWVSMESENVLRQKQMFLRDIIRDKNVKLDFQDIRVSMLESAFARGGSNLNGIVFKAWKNGARLDAWREFLNIELWEKVFQDAGLSLDSAARNPFQMDELLPWDFIDTGVPKARLMEEAKRAMV